MSLILWDDKQLSVGIKKIDDQHKQLVHYINQLSSAINDGRGDVIIDTLFKQLYDYTQYHFQDEEKYFFSLNPQDLKLHQLQHKHFVEELYRIKQEKAELISADLLFFLTDWLINHIQVEDRKFIETNR